jgi:thymidylate synthase (FAD)
MDKIQVYLVSCDDIKFEAQLACMITRGANKYADIDKFIQTILDNSWDIDKVNNILNLPHSKLSRFTTYKFLVFGSSRRFLAQLMTHHTGISVMSGSLQYSDFSKQHLDDMFTVPYELLNKQTERSKYLDSCLDDYTEYVSICKSCSNDTAGYSMPQGLRNVLYISVNLEELRFIGNQRLCRRNTDETRYVFGRMIEEVVKITGIDDRLFLPSCSHGKCFEGKYCCGKPIEPTKTITEYLDEEFPLLRK